MATNTQAGAPGREASSLPPSSKRDTQGSTFWALVDVASRWYGHNKSGAIGALPRDTHHDAFGLAANVLLIRDGLRSGHVLEYDSAWTDPPTFADDGVQPVVISEPGEERTLVWYTTVGAIYEFHRRVVDSAFGAKSAPEKAAADGGTLRWMATCDLFSFEIWNEPVSRTADLEAIIGRGRELTAALAPYHFAVQAEIE